MAKRKKKRVSRADKQAKNTPWSEEMKAKILAHVFHTGRISAAHHKYGVNRRTIQRWMKENLQDENDLDEAREAAHARIVRNIHTILSAVSDRLKKKALSKRGLKLSDEERTRAAAQLTKMLENMQGIEVRFSGSIDHTISTGEVDERIAKYRELLGLKPLAGDGDRDADSGDDGSGDSKGTSDS